MMRKGKTSWPEHFSQKNAAPVIMRHLVASVETVERSTSILRVQKPQELVIPSNGSSTTRQCLAIDVMAEHLSRLTI
jgi:hypothetical protein